jgi:hypothetical protein
MPEPETNPSSSPAKRVTAYLSEKTWISLGFVLTLLTAAVALTHTAGGIDKKFTQQEHQNDLILQRLAAMSDKMSTMVTREEFRAREAAWHAWVREYRASLPVEQRQHLPEPPK